MDYAQQQRNPAQHIAGISLVILLHIVLVYALINGLARKIVDVIKAPLDVRLIEELKTPPPPPPPPPIRKLLVTPPKVLQPPPPVYVPPPEVVVNTPPPPPEVVITTTVAPPPAVVETAPAPVAAKAETPATVSIGAACPNHQAVQSNVEYPTQAQRKNLNGDVTVEFTVETNGSLKDITVIKSSNKIFNAAAVAAVSRLQCVGQNRSVQVRIPFEFRISQ